MELRRKSSLNPPITILPPVERLPVRKHFKRNCLEQVSEPDTRTRSGCIFALDPWDKDRPQLYLLPQVEDEWRTLTPLWTNFSPSRLLMMLELKSTMFWICRKACSTVCREKSAQPVSWSHPIERRSTFNKAIGGVLYSRQRRAGSGGEQRVHNWVFGLQGAGAPTHHRYLAVGCCCSSRESHCSSTADWSGEADCTLTCTQPHTHNSFTRVFFF